MPQMTDGSSEQAGGEEISGQKGNRPAGGFGGMEERGHEAPAEAKGIKAGNSLTISGGKITVKSADDSLHSNGTITITGGEITLVSGDDGIHAEDSVSIAEGTIRITQSYEGIEGHIITVDGGQIDLTASNDGFNAGGDASVSMPTITINNGNIYVNAQGDGLDSNGDLIFNGGFVTVDGPTSGGDSALDVGKRRQNACRRRHGNSRRFGIHGGKFRLFLFSALNYPLHRQHTAAGNGCHRCKFNRQRDNLLYK